MSQLIYSQNFKNIEQLPNFNKYQEQSLRASQNLSNKINNKEIAAIDAIFDDKNINLIKELSQDIAKYNKIFVLGVGGSSLGAKTMASLKFQNKVNFLESIDTQTIANSLSEIDCENSFFIVISKSGETIETICQTLIIINKIKELNIKNYADKFLFITETKNSSLTKIAQEIGSKTTPHNAKIGGRYSCFSIVGLLPAILAGINIDNIIKGAQIVLKDFINDPKIISGYCAIQLSIYNQGFSNNVMMPYIDNLKNFTDWYRQLWAESLGKDNFGSTPINSMGTIDQHSQLQLYLDGPKDKFFTFITHKNHPNDQKIKDINNCPTLFGSKKLSDIVKIEQETTIETLNQKQLPIRIFECETLNEEVLAGLMMQSFIETIIIAYTQNIDPFDQPAVELRKNLARQLLKK